MPAALGLRAGATVQAATGRHFQREREKRGVRIIPASAGDYQKKEQFFKALVYMWQQRQLSSGQGTSNVFLSQHCLRPIWMKSSRLQQSNPAWLCSELQHIST